MIAERYDRRSGMIAGAICSPAGGGFGYSACTGSISDIIDADGIKGARAAVPGGGVRGVAAKSLTVFSGEYAYGVTEDPYTEG